MRDEVKESKRAVRRHHRERLKRKRASYGNVLTEKQLLKAIDTPRPCSCALCGNPRRYEGEKTAAELRMDADLGSYKLGRLLKEARLISKIF